MLPWERVHNEAIQCGIIDPEEVSSECRLLSTFRWFLNLPLNFKFPVIFISPNFQIIFSCRLIFSFPVDFQLSFLRCFSNFGNSSNFQIFSFSTHFRKLIFKYRFADDQRGTFPARTRFPSAFQQRPPQVTCRGRSAVDRGRHGVRGLRARHRCQGQPITDQHFFSSAQSRASILQLRLITYEFMFEILLF